MKHKLIKQIGISVRGSAKVTLWDNTRAQVHMRSSFIPNGKITHNNLKTAINDGGYGCQHIDSAVLEIYIRYDCGYEEFDRMIQVLGSQIPIDAPRGSKVLL